jgi:hypothetical protein
MSNLPKPAKYRSRRLPKYIKFNNNNEEKSNNNNILIRAILSKKAKIIPSKNKRKEYNSNIELETTIEIIILTAIELNIYYKEAYYTRRYTLILTNNLLVNIRQLIQIIKDIKAPTTH